MFEESNIVELKRTVTVDLKKEVIAFANANGGTIIVGVEDDGDVIGVENVDETINQISSMLRDAIRPDITMFVHVRSKEIDNRKVIMIDINPGERKPYYLTSKGMRSTGVYIRQGHSAAPVSEEQIRVMIKESDGVSFERSRSLKQELSFDYCKSQFDKENLLLESTQLKNLGFIRLEDGMYSNLGLLFSDQAKHTIKVALFQDETKSVFRDRQEFTGSILKQLEETYRYINIHNKNHAEINGLYREEKRDYPEVAIREALLNAVIHREYALSGSTLISIFADRIEIVSLGGLIKGITVEDIQYGISMTRNEKIAHVFYRLKLVEAYGTGISKVFESYNTEKIKPKIEVSDNVFKLTLYNRNYDRQVDDINNEQMQILNLIEKKGEIKRKDVEALLGISQTMSGRIIKQLVSKNLIVKIGNASTTRYKINKQR